MNGVQKSCSWSSSSSLWQWFEDNAIISFFSGKWAKSEHGFHFHEAVGVDRRNLLAADKGSSRHHLDQLLSVVVRSGVDKVSKSESNQKRL
jgi:hypothetical protein